jgi:chemotaxis protein CheX
LRRWITVKDCVMPQTTVGPLAEQDLPDIFNQVCDAYLASGAAVIDAHPPDAAAPDTAVVATVSVTGAWDGYIRLRCAAGTAAEVAAGMLDLDPGDVAADDIDHAMGELINILGGNIKCLLPQPAQLGLPIVGVGRTTSSASPPPSRCTTWRCTGTTNAWSCRC